MRHLLRRVTVRLIVLAAWLAFVPTYGQEELGTGVYVLPVDALDDFAPKVSQDELAKNIPGWLKAHHYEWLKADENPKHELYVYYKVKLMGYMFGPYTSGERQTDALKALLELRNTLLELQVKEAPWISAQAVFLDTSKPFGGQLGLKGQGQILSTNARDSLEAESKAELAARQLGEVIGKIDPNKVSLPPGLSDPGRVAAFKQALDDLAQAFNDAEGAAGKNELYEPGKAQGGATGPFPASVAFNKWFATVVKVALEILDKKFCGGQCLGPINKVLALAYMVMPDVMDRIASTLAELQRGLLPEELNNGLDHVADVFDKVTRVLDEVMRVYDMIKSADFKQLAKDLNLGDVTDLLAKGGIKIPLIGKLCEEHPTFCNALSYSNLSTFDKAKFLESAKKYTKEFAEETIISGAEKIAQKIPGLDRFDFNALNAYRKGKLTDRQFLEQQAIAMGCSHLSGFAGDCAKAVKGDYKGAMRGAVEQWVNSAIDDKYLRRMLLAQAYLVGEASEGGLKDWKVAFSDLAGRYDLDPALVKEVLSTDFKGLVVGNDLVELVKDQGVTDSNALASLKALNFTGAIGSYYDTWSGGRTSFGWRTMTQLDLDSFKEKLIWARKTFIEGAGVDAKKFRKELKPILADRYRR